ncbi:MAG: MBL fold metallo-hydrolase [Muribaculaceae bacterium]|nr:MBL fold metallo-hydrolase [Muribaculaceae bacterium]
MAKITMLGTGNAMCTRCYNTCFYLESPEGGLMVDAGGGNGIFRQLFRADIVYEQIHNIFVTHVHTDHIMGVIWMIRKISPMMYRGKYTGTLTIYCHDEVAHAIKEMCRLMIPAKICTALDTTILFKVVTDGETVRIDDMDVTFFDLGSDKTKQFGFRAVMPDGKSVVCHGDEPYCERNEKYVRGCDWFMCEAFCLYKDREQFRPYEKMHSTAIDAGRIAQGLDVKNLLLYHTEDTHLTTRRLTYTAEAAQHFKGTIAVPDDIETITI